MHEKKALKKIQTPTVMNLNLWDGGTYIDSPKEETCTLNVET